MIRILVATIILAFGAATAQAQNVDIIKKRIETYKSILPDLKIGKQMLKGQLPFDATAAKKVFTTYAAAAKMLKTMFPDDSKTGADTRALPAIWEKKADFDAKMAKFETDSLAAVGTITDLGSFKAAWGDVMSNCGGCHKPYRAKKEKK